MPSPLLGRRIVVTGGSRGIGAAVVRAYARAGASVESLARESPEGHATAVQASDQGPGTARFTACDVSNRGQVEVAFADAVERMGGLDVVAHIAGAFEGAPAEDVSDELLEQMFRSNLLATVIVNQAAFHYMRDAGTGAIINFGSEAGVDGNRNPGIQAAYGAAKAGVHAWTRHVAREWGPHGIRVNAVLPYIWTPMYDDFRASMSPDALAEHDAKTRSQVPLGGKFGDPDLDMAPVMVFLASEDARFITGQMLNVDGGLVFNR
jgi:NAD(P)-dependent dehydrogenase (short-subunit alcohol dehydrogenase family)